MKKLTMSDLMDLPKGTLLKVGDKEYHFDEVNRRSEKDVYAVCIEYVVTEKRHYIDIDKIDSVNREVYDNDSYG